MWLRNGEARIGSAKQIGGLLPVAPSQRESLSPEIWERRLTDHYLKADGPFGGTPLTFLDATPAELANASGLSDIDEVEAQQCFIDQFEEEEIRLWLSGKAILPNCDRDVPTYFRFLVLTCLVSATEIGAGGTHNFRNRLGEILGSGKPFSSVSGVNDLWRELAGWCDRRRAAGEPYRRVILPDYGTMNLIGYAVRLAFPSLRDRSVLTNILRTFTPTARRSPELLVQELSRQKHVHLLSQAVADALEDFSTAVRARRRMLLGHRLWRLVQSIDSDLIGEERAGGLDRWRLEIRFSGYEQDVVYLSLLSGLTEADASLVWEGGLQEVEDRPQTALPSALAKRLHEGILLFAEAPGAIWVMDDERVKEDASIIIVARAASIVPFETMNTSWRKLEGRWLVSGRLDQSDLRALSPEIGMGPTSRTRLVDLVIQGGVKTSRTTWLGRPNFLPLATASSSSALFLEALSSARGTLRLSGEAPSWQLKSEAPLSGQWRIKAVEAGAETEKIVCFEDEAPERRTFFADDANFEREEDLLIRSEVEATTKPYKDDSYHAADDLLLDILEAIYAGPLRGWTEADLVALLRSVLPNTHFIWDFLRGLVEAGWIVPLVSRSWRARVWRLCSPLLIPVDQRTILVEGALGAAARRRLEEIAGMIGGRLRVHAGVSPWAPPSLIVSDAKLGDLAFELGWQVRTNAWYHCDPAPHCWPSELRSGEGRTLAGIWSFEQGLFVAPKDNTRPPNHEVSLERLVRERGDDRDLFRLSGNGAPFLTCSRTVAILEAYRRRGVPLFDWTSGSLQRLSRSGHLPIAIARALRGRSLCASGPVICPDGSWSYLYPADKASVRQLKRTFGTVIKQDFEPNSDTFLDHVARQRRLGRRPVWYRSPAARGRR